MMASSSISFKPTTMKTHTDHLSQYAAYHRDGRTAIWLGAEVGLFWVAA